MEAQAFTLDTSGSVALEWPLGRKPVGITWSDLTSFQQGYVEALFSGPATWTGGRTLVVLAEWAGFSDLAPEALALILKDCEAADHLRPGVTSDGDHKAGHRFWELRQSGAYVRFPPLTVTLGDDGKVYLSAAGQALSGNTQDGAS